MKSIWLHVEIFKRWIYPGHSQGVKEDEGEKITDEIKTRVFISCGQRKYSEEEIIAE